MSQASGHEIPGSKMASSAEAGGALNWIWGLVTSKMFLFYCLCNYAWVIYAYAQTLKKFTNRSAADIARDEKYSAFKRNDIEKIKKKWLTALVLSPLIVLKGVATYTPWAVMLVISLIVQKLDCTKKSRVQDRWSFKVMRLAQIAVARWDFLWYGGWPGLISCVDKFVDYSEYLGPEWKEDKEKVPTIVIANHSSFVDIIVQMYMGMPSFVAKNSVRGWPVIGKCAEIFGCLFLERDNKSSQRNTVT